MLILDDEITLFGIDTVSPQRTLEAFEYSCRWVRFADIVLLTDLDKHPHLHTYTIQSGPKLCPVRVIHHVESDRKVPRPNPEYKPLPIDYEIASLREPIGKFSTSHILFAEWDSAVLNPLAWNAEWLTYDYIGAPWHYWREPGWDICDGHTNNVGNAGFSLRSQTYCRAVAKMLTTFPEDLALMCCDMTPCINRRKWLEGEGVKFAPDSVSRAFSCENTIYAGQFGYHGTWTVLANGWGGPFFSTRSHDYRQPVKVTLR